MYTPFSNFKTRIHLLEKFSIPKYLQEIKFHALNFCFLIHLRKFFNSEFCRFMVLEDKQLQAMLVQNNHSYDFHTHPMYVYLHYISTLLYIMTYHTIQISALCDQTYIQAQKFIACTGSWYQHPTVQWVVCLRKRC